MLWLVRHRGAPLLGWVDTFTGEAFPHLPVARHYREGGAWIPVRSEADAPASRRSRMRVREDLAPELFVGEVLEAEDPESARNRFAELAEIDERELEVDPAPPGATPGLHGGHGMRIVTKRRPE
ncbi:MAG TPA: hypothetical protein DEA08_19645 [Planctomycetes bacterium]|nr:hypothetical protein [Planctomycetota bacterium]